MQTNPRNENHVYNVTDKERLVFYILRGQFRLW